MNEGDALLKEFGDRSVVRPRRAQYLGPTAEGRAQVNLGGQLVTVDFAAGFIPEAYEFVHVWQVDDKAFLIGPVRAKPARGMVATTSSTLLTVNTSSGVISMPFVGSQPLVGDTVAIFWGDGPIALGRISSIPTYVPPTPPSPPADVRSATFQAIDTGSTFRSSVNWHTTQPWASSSNYGAWFYGEAIKNTIPAGAAFISLEMYIAWRSRSGNAPKFALHNQFYKAGIPAYSGSIDWVPEAGWNVTPNAEGWFHALKAGGAYAGVGLDTGGFNKFASRAEDALTGALRITWRQ